MRKCILILGLFFTASIFAGPFNSVNINTVHWKKTSKLTSLAVVKGSPKKAGQYALLVKYLPGFVKMPHIHPHSFIVTVLSGSLKLSMGKTLSSRDSKAAIFSVGDVFIIPKDKVHYEMVVGHKPFIAMVTGLGPLKTVYYHSSKS